MLLKVFWVFHMFHSPFHSLYGTHSRLILDCVLSWSMWMVERYVCVCRYFSCYGYIFVVVMAAVLPLVTREGILWRPNTFLWHWDYPSNRISSSKWNCLPRLKSNNPWCALNRMYIIYHVVGELVARQRGTY